MSFILLGILNSQAAGAVGAGSYDLLETTVLGSDQSSVSFTGLGSYSDYKHLQIRFTSRGTRTNNTDTVDLQFNSDTGNNYAKHEIRGNDGTVTSSATTSTTSIRIGVVTGAIASSGQFGAGVADILDFSSTAKNTTVRSLTAGNNEIDDIRFTSGLYTSTSAITSILLKPFSDSFATGSRFSLYGIKAA